MAGSDYPYQRPEHADVEANPAIKQLAYLGPPEIQADFVRKVYGILCSQLVFLVTICVAAIVIEPLRYGLIDIFKIPGLQFIIFIPTICVLCALMAYKDKHPVNYYLLAAFTLLTSVPIGAICAVYYSVGLGVTLLQAALLTMAIFMALTAYAMYSGQDFSWMGACLSASLFGLIMWGCLAYLFGFKVGLVYSSLGALIFCGFIVYDTWRVMKEYGPDDAIIAAIQLFLDIINLFLYILEILSRSSSSD